MVKAGTMDLRLEENVENVVNVILGCSDKLPFKHSNILSIHLKTETSTALPIFCKDQSSEE